MESTKCGEAVNAQCQECPLPRIGRLSIWQLPLTNDMKPFNIEGRVAAVLPGWAFWRNSCAPTGRHRATAEKNSALSDKALV